MESYRIPNTNDELLEECEVQTFRSSGCGGQNVNRRETAVRLIHNPSGIVITCQQERSQYRNKYIALERLRTRLEQLNRPRRTRKPTKMPHAVRERILARKKRQSEKKKLRRKPEY